MRPVVRLLVIALVLVACGPSARQQTLRTMLTGATAAQAGFIAWNGEQLDHIAETAQTAELGMDAIEAHEKAVEPVVKAFEVVYRAIAQAALVDSEPLTSAVGAFEELRAALKKLTNGRLP